MYNIYIYMIYQQYPELILVGTIKLLKPVLQALLCRIFTLY